jgi:DNA uptake protein ComE-like DNA-binding protein
MKRSIVQSALIAAILLLPAGLALAADTKTMTAGETKASSAPKPAEKGAKAAKAPAKVNLVDINSAGKAELKTLPGISDAEADKIIAGRPYLTKAHLVTHNIIPPEAYGNLKGLVIAKQKPDAKVKPAK